VTLSDISLHVQRTHFHDDKGFTASLAILAKCKLSLEKGAYKSEKEFQFTVPPTHASTFGDEDSVLLSHRCFSLAETKAISKELKKLREADS